MLEFKNVSYGWKANEPLQKGIDFHLQRGGILAVLGSNGCGKSSLMSIFTNPDMLLGGTILIDGRNFRDFSGRKLFSVMSLVAQNSSVVYPYTVLEFVLTGWFPWLGIMGVPGKREISSTEDVLNRIGIGDWSNRLITTLSGGEFKLVQLARAMVGERKILILDEIDSALDFANQIKLTDILCSFAEKGGSIVLITHNPNLPLVLRSDALIMSKSIPFIYGSAEEVIVPDILEKYFNVRVGQITGGDTGCRQIMPLMHL